jgi:hypothetical protein
MCEYGRVCKVRPVEVKGMKQQSEATSLPDAREKRGDHGSWSLALAHALPIVVLVLALHYYWFAIADRYIVFLYHHDMGPLYPDTSPFSRVTSSRYWMAGLVASGLVAAPYGMVNWLLGRIVPNYHLPKWWRVWIICAICLAAGIPGITMSVNQPTLHVVNAVQVTLVTWIGLALALMPGRLAAEAPTELVWLSADGLGLMLVLLYLIHLEDLSTWLARGRTLWVWMMAASLIAGVVWLLIVTGVGVWRRRPVPGAGEMFIAGLYVAYLGMPAVHHLIGTNGYYYISDSDNFFATNQVVQVATWLAAGGMAAGVTWLRGRLAARRAQMADAQAVRPASRSS